MGKQGHSAWLQGGLVSIALFAAIFLVSWLIPDLGPEISLDWWVYVLIGLLLLAVSKMMTRLTYETVLNRSKKGRNK